MEEYWKDQSGGDESFWEHVRLKLRHRCAQADQIVQEWGKHGTCYSTLSPSCYTDYHSQEEVVDFFSQTTNLFKTLPTYEVSFRSLSYQSSV